MILTCAACNTTLEVDDPKPGYTPCGRCGECEGIMLPPPPSQTAFPMERNITHTREDY